MKGVVKMFLLLVCFLGVVSSCSSFSSVRAKNMRPKNTSGEESNHFSEAITDLETNSKFTSKDTLQGESNPLSQTGPDSGPDSAAAKEAAVVSATIVDTVQLEVLNFRRTSCYGRCPVYDFKIYEDGSCEIIGKLFFLVVGAHKAQLTDAQYAEVMKRIEDIDYFQLKAVYDDPYVQDVPASYISVRANGRVKEIKSRYQSPPKLVEFLTYLHKMANELEWRK